MELLQERVKSVSTTQNSNCLTELVLFGSRATGDARAGSDWDLLAIMNEPPKQYTPRIECGPFELYSIERRDLQDRAWLTSEIAIHIASFGVWLLGERGKWCNNVSAVSDTLRRKAQVIQARVAGVLGRWEGLHEIYRSKHLELVNRDAQRFDYLSRGLAIPSTPKLENEWEVMSEGERFSKVKKTLKEVGANTDILDRWGM